MLIRTAAIEDLEAVAQVEAECFAPEEAAKKQDFRERLSSYPNHFLLMFDGGKLIGFINGMVTNEPNLTDEMYKNADMHNENGKWQMIFGVNTIPTYRKRGYAETLIKQFISDAKEQGRKGVVLTCKDVLVPYYAKFGFVAEGISQSTHGNIAWQQMRLRFN